MTNSFDSALRVPRATEKAETVTALLFAALVSACAPESLSLVVREDAATTPAADAASYEQDADPALDAAVRTEGPTWHRDVAALLADRCGACHQPDGIAPFSVHSYARARPYATLMAEAVEQGRMPPFLAQETAECMPRLPWAHDPRLSQAERRLLRAWADGGAVEGDPADSVPVALSSAAGLAREDLSLVLPRPLEVEGTQDLHICIILDPKLDRDRYVIGTLTTPGNKKIVHHAQSFILLPVTKPVLFGPGPVARSKAQLITAAEEETKVKLGEPYECKAGNRLTTVPAEILDVWAPGGTPRKLPLDAGTLMPADALVLLDIHYHPTGGRELDGSTRLGIQFADHKPPRIAKMVEVGNFPGDYYPFYPDRLLAQPGESKAEFVIPAGESQHVEEMLGLWRIDHPVRVYSLFTHMHYVGKDIRVSLERAAGASECLIEAPQWDFNWQLAYDYDAPYEQLPELRSGDKVRVHCVYDNTVNNRAVRAGLSSRGLSAPVDVKLGADTDDEMCLVFLGITYPNPL